MSAKEYFKQAPTLKKLIDAKKARIQELRELAEWAGRGITTNTKVQKSKKSDPMTDLIAKAADLHDECVKDYMRLLELQWEMESIINSVEKDEQRLVLYERYINLKKWEEIAEENTYSEKHVFKLHGAALQNVKLDTK